MVGAGIHGAWAAWDATLRGLSVAVVDRGEFGGATSANSLRIVHGGLRYLARGDLARMRESIQERATLLRVAPRFVVPLPVLIPTFTDLTRGRTALGALLALNNLVSGRAVPPGRLVTPAECHRLFPAVDRRGLTGGAIWYDGLLRDPVGLVGSILRAAQARGAVAVPYLRVHRILVRDGTAWGASGRDGAGNDVDIEARAVLIAAGPWTEGIVRGQGQGGVEDHSPPGHSFAMNIRLQRRFADVAVGLWAGGGRYMFLVPDGDHTLLGTWYALPEGSTASALARRGARALLAELNAACPGLELAAGDVARHDWGWLPGRPNALADRPRIVDLGRAGGPRRVVTLQGVKFTTARRVAERGVDRVVAILGARQVPCRTGQVPL